MMTAITGHLVGKESAGALGGLIDGALAYLQNVAAMQLSQLEKAVVTDESSSVILLSAMPLSAKAFCILLPSIPITPPLTLLVMATSIEGISTR